MFPFTRKKDVIHVDETIIIIDGEHFRKHDPHKNEDITLERIIEKLTNIITILTTPTIQPERVRLIIQTILNDSIFTIMSITLKTTEFSIDSIGLINSDNGQPHDATFSNVSFESSDANVFTSTPDSGDPNKTRNEAVTAGSATLTAKADATYTDANTGQEVTKTGLSVVVDVTVTEVAVGEENVALVINQGTPQPK